MEVPQDVWHCLESDVVANRQDPPRFPAVLLIGQTLSVAPLALLDVVVASCPMEDFSTTSSSATQPLHLKVCANRRMGLTTDYDVMFLLAEVKPITSH